MRARSLTLFLAVLAAVVLTAAACGGGGGDSSGKAEATTGASGSGGGATLELVADPNGAFKFDKTSLDASAGKVTIDLTNDSSVPHNVTIEGSGIDEVATDTVTGDSASVSVDLPAGTYEYYCSVDGHKDAGMKGTLTVN